MPAPTDGRGLLARSLRRCRGRALRVGGGAALGWGVVGAALCLIFGTWLDLVFELSAALRVGVVVASASAGLLLMAAFGTRAWLAGRADVLARRLDEVGATGGQVRTGADLLDHERPGSPLGRGLAEVAIDRAAALADRVSPGQVIPVKPMMMALLALVGTTAVIGLAWLFEPQMVRTEYPRFSDPFGDHPPYSRVTYTVEPGHAAVVYADPQEIRVTTSGPPVDRLELVLLAGDSSAAEVLPMFGEPGGLWRATVASVTSPLQYFVRCKAGRSHRFSLDVITLPKLESVRFQLTPPAYTNRGAYEGGLPQGGLAGLPGTRVRVSARSNRPLSGGTLQVTGAQGDSVLVRTEMQPAAPGEHEVSAAFELREPGRLEVRVRDVDGAESQEAFSTALSVLSDERPFVRLLDPPQVSLSTNAVALPVVLAAEDDYGISRLSLYRSLNDSRAIPVDLAVPIDPYSNRQNVTSLLPLPAYGLRPGDEIKLFARVEDNDPAGAKGAESPVAVVRIISQNEYERLVLTREGMEVLLAKYRQSRDRMEEIARLIEALQNELEDQADDSELSAEARRRISELADRMKEEAEAMARSAESTLPFDIDSAMSDYPRDLAAKLAEAGQAVDDFAESEPSPTAGEAKEGLEAIRKFCEGSRAEYDEQAVEPLEYMAKVFPLIRDEARFVELYRRQLDLADRLESLRNVDGGDDPLAASRMRDLESEQYRIREDLRALPRDIQDHVRQLPDRPEVDQLRETASAFVAAVRESGASEAMAEAEAGLAALSGTRSAEAAREAEQILREFLADCQAMGERGESCLQFNPGLGGGLGDTVNQLLNSAGAGRTGMGMAGGGYSAQMSTLDNVGLFGQLPALTGGGMAGDGKDSQSAWRGRRSGEGDVENAEPGNVQPLESLRAVGANRLVVPPEYRQRVGAYFERITDELGEDER